MKSKIPWLTWLSILILFSPFISNASTKTGDADLAIGKTASTNSVKVGDQFFFQLSVTNLGPDNATNVIVLDILPPGCAYVFSSGTGTYYPNYGLWIFSAGPAGAVSFLTITMQATGAGTITNTAFILGSDITDTNTANDTSAATITVTSNTAPIDVGVTIATSSAGVFFGSNFTYTITVTNLGPAAASGVVLYDSLPVNFELQSSNASQGSLAVLGVDVTADLGSLVPGATATITLGGVSTSLDLLQNVATVTANENDPNPTNDVDIASTLVVQAPQIQTQPEPLALPCGHFGDFSVTATGTLPLYYQWLRNGAPIPGETDVLLDIGAVYTANDGQQYSVVVSNAYGKATSTNAILHVADADAPELLCPDTITVLCAGAAGTPVTFSVGVSDNCDSTPSLTCIPPSGSAFAVGSNWVQCAAVDASGNSNTCGFAVIVVDALPPIIITPPPLTVYCSTQGGGFVTFTVTATDDCDTNVSLVCTPPSGSHFPVGTTLVSCVASDSSGNTASAEFAVTVLDPTPALMAIELEGTNVMICWPVACSDYELFFATQLGGSLVWTPLAHGPPAVINNHYCITVPITGFNTFFQLQSKPALNSVIAKADGKKQTLANLTKNVAFTATVTGENCGNYTYAWEFGDGGTSTEQNPAHAYATTGEFIAKVTATCAADPTQKKSDTAKVIVPKVEITLDGVVLDPAKITTNIVAVQGVFGFKITPKDALAGGVNHWFLGADDPPKKNVAIRTYVHNLYDFRGEGFEHIPTEFTAADMQKDILEVFFTKPQSVTLRFENTKDGKIFVAQVPLKVEHDVDPNRNIYARLKPDKKYNPNGRGGFYAVTYQHKVFHFNTDANNTNPIVADRVQFKYGEKLAQDIVGDPDADTGRDRLMAFKGTKWFDYHAAMIQGYLQWRTTFNVTDAVSPLTKDRGPDAPSFFTTAGGSLRSPVYKYVRLDEYPNDNQLGTDVHPWHVAGHINRSLNGNLPTGPVLPPAKALPGIASGADNVAAVTNAFWDWHSTIEDFRQKTVFTLTNGLPTPASKTATAPMANDPAVPKGLTTIIITFDKPVSINGPSKNKACARNKSLLLTPPGGLKPGEMPVTSDTVEWDGGDPKKLKFTIPKLEAPGEWNVELPETTRGFLRVTFKFTIK